MTRPPEILTSIPKIKLDYYHYNDIDGPQDFREGIFEVSALVTQAWMYRDEKLGILFVNLKEDPMNISFKVNPADYGLPPEETYRYTYIARGIWKILHTSVGEVTLQVELPPRRVILIEVSKCMPTYGSLRGRVSGLDDRGIAGAYITLQDSRGFEETATTGLDGTFQIDGVPAGIYNLTVEKSGYTNQTICSVVIKNDEIKNVNITMSGISGVLWVNSTGILRDLKLKDDGIYLNISLFDSPLGVLELLVEKKLILEKSEISKLKIFIDGNAVETLKDEDEGAVRLICNFKWFMSNVSAIISFTREIGMESGETATADLSGYFIAAGFFLIAIIVFMLIKGRILKH